MNDLEYGTQKAWIFIESENRFVEIIASKTREEDCRGNHDYSYDKIMIIEFLDDEYIPPYMYKNCDYSKFAIFKDIADLKHNLYNTYQNRLRIIKKNLSDIETKISILSY